MTEFKINGDFIPLVQLLKATGLIETGGHAKIMVDNGLVVVNGKKEHRKRAKIKPGDLIEVSGQVIRIV